MSEDDLYRALNARPDRVTFDICGQNRESGEWTCKMDVFGSAFDNLTVNLRKRGGVWRVEDWMVNR